MKHFLAILAVAISISAAGCVTMEDCCECLAQADALSCDEPYQECVDKCFALCEPTRACYCSDAIDVGCAVECGCSL
jgi:hypothetical protein